MQCAHLALSEQRAECHIIKVHCPFSITFKTFQNFVGIINGYLRATF